MDITVIVFIVAILFAIVLFKTKAALIITYVISGFIAIYGLATIIANMLEPNRLSSLAYIVGGVLLLFSLGLASLARKLYKNKIKKSIAVEKSED